MTFGFEKCDGVTYLVGIGADFVGDVGNGDYCIKGPHHQQTQVVLADGRHMTNWTHKAAEKSGKRVKLCTLQ